MPLGGSRSGSYRNYDENRAEKLTTQVGLDERFSHIRAVSESTLPSNIADSIAGCRIVSNASGNGGRETDGTLVALAKPARTRMPRPSRPAHPFAR